ncbi:spore germination protein [Brevibacillus antibioticus]|uniref:Spore germination protein n=1 Tax=Brevibacillus antibioticus TaxID=2570228 RepID=A0A4U2YEX2_9BACL|nr:spore germination protein [Brevibacillus antibioticus]TKI59064.1 spore germination protein [Brevibacillus antibioticus]
MKPTDWWRTQVEAIQAKRRIGSAQARRSEQITPDMVKQCMQNVDDLSSLSLKMNDEEVHVFFLETLVDESQIYENVFLPLQRSDGKDPMQALPFSKECVLDDMETLMSNLLRGHTILFFLERDLILHVNTFQVAHRSITKSETEATVLGPQDSFVEMQEINLSLLRRRLATPHLKVLSYTIGTEAQNKVAVIYLDNIANAENVERVKKRIDNVRYHGFVGMPILKQMLEDKPYSPFPQFGLTGRPDNATAALLDGRLVIMLNGSPDAAICPTSFLEMFSSPEDFYNRWSTASLLRMIRFFGLFITIMLTSSYVSVLTYHPEMLPPALLTILSESRSRVPFPPVIEVLIIELVIEILREAGIRMPTKIGQTIGIVGGIVIGTASVQAGLASNILIVLVSVSALLSFVPPNFLMSNAIRLVRYGFILMAGVLGMYGQILALAFLFAHLLNLTSLGTPYMAPGVPRQWTDLMNSLVRAPLRFIVNRNRMSRAKQKRVRPVGED